MSAHHIVRNSRSMPRMSEMMTGRSMPYLSEMMTDMYMDIVIKEYNNPQPSTTEEQNSIPNTVHPNSLQPSTTEEQNTSPNTVHPNDPQPSTTKEQNTRPNSLHEIVKKLQAQIALLEEMKNVHTERGMSTTMHTVIDARILELRRAADPYVESLKEQAAQSENVGAGETARKWGWDPFWQPLKEKVAESENVDAGETARQWRCSTFSGEVQSKYQEVPGEHYAE